jgi:outer membrane usher protein FimD/PapC
VSFDFESVLLGGYSFVDGYSVNPGLLLTLKNGITTGLDYRFRASSFKNSGTYTTNTDRDGVTHSVVISYRQPLSETMSMRLAYNYDREDAKVSAWSSNSHRAVAGLAVSLPYRMMLDVSADVVGKEYDGILNGATAVRTDTTVAGAVSLTWQASEHMSTSIGYHYTNNSSNIGDYGYTRGITSIMLQGRY